MTAPVLERIVLCMPDPVCETCNDTHRMSLGDRMVMCTRCPTPCAMCASGPYCNATPCVCACHPVGAAAYEKAVGTRPAPLTPEHVELLRKIDAGEPTRGTPGDLYKDLLVWNLLTSETDGPIDHHWALTDVGKEVLAFAALGGDVSNIRDKHKRQQAAATMSAGPPKPRRAPVDGWHTTVADEIGTYRTLTAEEAAERTRGYVGPTSVLLDAAELETLRVVRDREPLTTDGHERRLRLRALGLLELFPSAVPRFVGDQDWEITWKGLDVLADANKNAERSEAIRKFRHAFLSEPPSANTIAAAHLRTAAHARVTAAITSSLSLEGERPSDRAALVRLDKELRASALRYSATCLRESGEANTSDAALLLDQIAEDPR